MKSSPSEAGTNNRPRRWMAVDDNPEYLMLLQKAVRLIARREIECFDGPHSALSVFEAKPGAFEFVITDLEMPGMNGLELCRRMRELSPSLKVLLVTGSGRLQDAEIQQQGFCGLLRKPFPINSLARTLAAAGMIDSDVMAPDSSMTNASQS